MTKPSYEELKFELAYIAISPAQENGGFHPRVVKAAKDALFEIERVRGLLQRISHRLNRQLMGGVGSTHEDASLLREIEQILTGAESADIGKLDSADKSGEIKYPQAIWNSMRRQGGGN